MMSQGRSLRLFSSRRHRHPCSEKPSVVSDIGLRLSEGIQDLKLEQQLAPTREAISRTLAAGSTNFFNAVAGVRGPRGLDAFAALLAAAPRLAYGVRVLRILGDDKRRGKGEGYRSAVWGGFNSYTTVEHRVELSLVLLFDNCIDYDRHCRTGNKGDSDGIIPELSYLPPKPIQPVLRVHWELLGNI